MKTSSVLICIAIVLVALPVRVAASEDVPVVGQGIHTLTFSREGAQTISYALSVPAGYDGEAPVPLVLALHFGVQGGSSLNAGRDLLRLLIAPGFAELRAVIVAPDSLGGRQWHTPENESAVMALLDAVTRSYRIDARKVIVTGFSMGGAGAWHFAGKYPERFAAAVPVAGRPPESAEGWRVPVFAVHSLRDEVVPLRPTADRVRELKRAGVKAEIAVLDGPTHFETGAHVTGVKRAVPWLRPLFQQPPAPAR